MAETAIVDKEPVDADVVPPEEDGPGTALEKRETSALSVAPQVQAEELGARLATIKQAMENEMTPDVDYGVIPGTGGKPTLLKPGAEKLAVLFQLNVQLHNEKVWDGSHLTVISHATVYHAPSGTQLGYGEGICSTREKKYAYRNAQRTCPDCDQPAVRMGRNRDSGQPENYYCWNKPERGSHGCGARFALDDERITSQEVGQIENPDLPDTWNTVVKMAEKRGRVDAVLAVTGASALFTQDVEDQPRQAAAPDAEEVEQLRARVAELEQQRRHGPVVNDSQRVKVSNAAAAICSGSRDGGRELYEHVKVACGGYMPQAAGLALVKAAERLEAMPWDPKYQNPRGDVPSTEQAHAEEVARESAGEATEAMVAGLGDEVLEAWIAAGLSEQEARHQIEGALHRRGSDAQWNALQQQLTKARDRIAQLKAVGG